MKARNRSTARKRIKRTGSGKYTFQKAARNHLLMQKSSGQKGKGRHRNAVDITNVGRVRAALPNL